MAVIYIFFINLGTLSMVLHKSTINMGYPFNWQKFCRSSFLQTSVDLIDCFQKHTPNSDYFNFKYNRNKTNIIHIVNVTVSY